MPASRGRPIGFAAVRLADPFWAPRQQLLATATLPAIHARMADAGMLAALDMSQPAGPMPLGFFPAAPGIRPTSPVMWFDSDVAKWLEAACYTLAQRPDAALQAQVEAVVTLFEGAQESDGYLNSYFRRRAPEDRFVNLRDWHELYCAGHLIEAAVAHHAATGSGRLMAVARRYVALLSRTFGAEPGKRRGYCGHPGIEMALTRLHEATGDPDALRLARYFVDARGNDPHWFDAEARERGEDPAQWHHRTYEYNQSHRPVRAQDKVVGHAVRAMYLYCAMTDLAARDGDAALAAACRRLWDDLTGKRLYVTGGLGPSASNEGFTRDFDLPNRRAYAETCAAVGLVMWARRMLDLTGEAHFADVMERALYNAASVGLSSDGTLFTYDNPLASRGDFHRWTWFTCPCCPANIARLVASVGGYMCSASKDAVSLHLYPAARIDTKLGEEAVRLVIAGDYPWSGEIAISVDPARPLRFALRLRRPDWCRDAALRINGVETPPAEDRGYLVVDRLWQPGDKVALSLAMRSELLHARTAVTEDIGRVAIRRGPVIYCVEEPDLGTDVERLAVVAAGPPERIDDPVLGLFAAVSVEGTLALDAEGPLYGPMPPARGAVALRAIPYALWGNRDQGTMAVWLRAGAKV